MSDQHFVLSDQDGVLVRHMSFQEKKYYLQPCKKLKMVHLNYLRNSALAFFRILLNQNSVFSSHFVATRDSRILRLEEHAVKTKRDYRTLSIKAESYSIHPYGNDWRDGVGLICAYLGNFVAIPVPLFTLH